MPRNRGVSTRQQRERLAMNASRRAGSPRQRRRATPRVGRSVRDPHRALRRQRRAPQRRAVRDPRRVVAHRCGQHRVRRRCPCSIRASCGGSLRPPPSAMSAFWHESPGRLQRTDATRRRLRLSRPPHRVLHPPWRPRATRHPPPRTGPHRHRASSLIHVRIVSLRQHPCRWRQTLVFPRSLAVCSDANLGDRSRMMYVEPARRAQGNSRTTATVPNSSPPLAFDEVFLNDGSFNARTR